MQRFTCPGCGRRAYFRSLRCPCGHDLYFDNAAMQMLNQAPPCPNRGPIACNWIAGPTGGLCQSCTLSQVVPNLSAGNNIQLLNRAERAKRWVLANVANWNWFTAADPGPRPRFLMLSEDAGDGMGRAQQIIMGHMAGEITINVTEADELIRLQRRQELGEQYRSMVGHFRHELAHFFFDRLAVAPGFLPGFRDLFGDERSDYHLALQTYYATEQEPSAEFITPYASAHPHEDWAETVAHLLHLIDMTDSFVSTGMTMPDVPDGFAPYGADDTEELLEIAARVAIAVNDINRALDSADLYPFVLTAPMRRKMGFAHGWLKNHLAQGA